MIYHSCDKSVFCFIFPWRRICVFVLLYRQWFVDRCLSFCSFSFCHGIVCPVNNDFWLPIWYIHTFLVPLHNNTIHIYYRWFVLWMWINHVNVTLCYECGSIMSTSHCSMNVDQSCQRHIVLWMWINHVNVTLMVKFVIWDAMKRPFQAKHINDRTCIENLETWRKKRNYNVTWENN